MTTESSRSHRSQVRLGELIRQARKDAGLSQAELAGRLQVTAGAVGQWEIGLTKPRLETLRRLAAVLRRPLSDFIGESMPHEATENSGGNERRHSVDRGAIELDRVLLEQAQSFGIEISVALNAHLRQLVGKARAEQWLKENREALADANAFLARHGLWSDGKRQF